jgi:hypothetical protein
MCSIVKKDQSVHDYILDNVFKLETFVKLAKKQENSDILVFPEYGLTSTQVLKVDNLTTFDHFAQELPNNRFKPCSGRPMFWSILDHISCISFSHQIYLVVNLVTRNLSECLKDVCYYNTALAFDRQGQIVAKYDKYNLYTEAFIDKPLQPRMAYFETDFGFKIGLLICFDINYPRPAEDLLEQVDIIAYPTSWTDELPFLTGNKKFKRGWQLACFSGSDICLVTGCQGGCRHTWPWVNLGLKFHWGPRPTNLLKVAIPLYLNIPAILKYAFLKLLNIILVGQLLII